MPIPTETIRKSICASADLARLWFEDRAQHKSREQFEKKDGLGDTGVGAEYAYLFTDVHALYVGQIGRTVKSRLHDETSPHKSRPWWRRWKTMRFIQLEDEMDRIILEIEFNESPIQRILTSFSRLTVVRLLMLRPACIQLVCRQV